MEEAFELSLFGGEALPLVVTPRKATEEREFLSLLGSSRAAVERALRRHGGVLFRGFPVADARAFEAVIDVLGLGKSVDYIGGDSPRRKVRGSVYTSTEAPPAIAIPLHNELSFVRRYPKHIYFFCEVPPAAHGETILADARRAYRALDSDVRDRFMTQGLKYVSCYYGRSFLMDVVNALQPSHKSWREVFETEDARVVERLCREHDFEWEWHGDNWIRISQTRPAAMQHPETGEWVWFSQAHLYDFNPRLLGWWRWAAAKAFYARRHTRLHEVFHRDGSRVRRDDLYHLMDTLDACTVRFPWRQGDVLVLDNVLAMHGRAPFSGKRRILAAMTG